MADTHNIIQLGFGKVGQELVRQVLGLWQQGRATHLRYIGLADSSALLLRPDGFSVNDLAAFLQVKVAGGGLAGAEVGIAADTLLPALAVAGIMGATIVDLTATADTLSLLAAARAAGHNLVFANKAPFAADYAAYRSIAPILNGGSAPSGWGKVRHEATVGAGLPVISTLESLLASGDTITRIEASVSGTLGFILATLDDGLSFSAALRLAHERGYTEPDPRDDLNGRDAARKALILARRMGLPLELADVVVESLVPAQLVGVSVSEFWAHIGKLDDTYRAKLEAAQRQGKVLRYAATIVERKARVGLSAVDSASPLGRLRGSDSIFIWHTARYRDTPIVVQGPGAGPPVTAAGVLADILQI